MDDVVVATLENKLLLITLTVNNVGINMAILCSPSHLFQGATTFSTIRQSTKVNNCNNRLGACTLADHNNHRSILHSSSSGTLALTSLRVIFFHLTTSPLNCEDLHTK